MMVFSSAQFVTNNFRYDNWSQTSNCMSSKMFIFAILNYKSLDN